MTRRREQRRDRNDQRADGVARQIEQGRVPEQHDERDEVERGQERQDGHDRSSSSNRSSASSPATAVARAIGSPVTSLIRVERRSRMRFASFSVVSGKPMKTVWPPSAPMKSASRSASTTASSARRNPWSALVG